MTDTSTHQPATAAGTFTIGGDLPVARLGFGAMRITGPGIWGEPRDRAECLRVLQHALQLGVNFIDTADAYGPEVSEELIAEALYPYPPQLVIATKGGLIRTGPGEWPHDARPQHLRAALDNSLRRLRLERVDLYQLHRPDPRVPFEESVTALAELQSQGKIRHVGLSNVSTEQLAAARRVVPIVSVQNRYSLDDRSSEDVLKVCERDSIAFIPWLPLGSGDPGAALQSVATAHGATSRQIVLAWLLRRSPVMIPIPGTSSVRHLEENVAAAEIELTKEEFDRLDRS